MRPTGPGGEKAEKRKKSGPPDSLLTSPETIKYIKSGQTRIESQKAKKAEIERIKNELYKEAEKRKKEAAKAAEKPAKKKPPPTRKAPARRRLPPKKLRFEPWIDVMKEKVDLDIVTCLKFKKRYFLLFLMLLI